MRLVRFEQGMIPAFLRLADREGWIAGSWELEFLLSGYPHYCWCAVDSNDQPVGFITGIRHEKSGWIGNLVVAQNFRGRGIGEALFLKTLEGLKRDRVATIWLTASETGLQLYKRHGFRGRDTIIRWSGNGAVRHSAIGADTDAYDIGECCEIDRAGWGDRRRGLLLATAARGRMVGEACGYAVLQPVGSMMQLGPFSARNGQAAGRLLAEALRQVEDGQAICVDVPAENRAAGRLYHRSGLRIVGRTKLMYVGRKPEYRSELIFGLATMGSCG